MIAVLSKQIASKIKSIVPEHPRSEQVLAYSISFLLNSLSIILLSMLVSMITGKVSEAIIVLVSFAILRQMSGGYHLDSGWMCIVVTSISVTAITYADFGYSIILILTTISILLAIIYAPSRIDKQTRIPKKYYPYLKILSLITISTSFLFESPVLTTSFFVQCLTLIHNGKEVKANQ